MSAKQQAMVQVVSSESMEIRPAVVVTVQKVFTALVSFIISVLTDDKGLKAWTAVERVSWCQGLRHEPVKPVWDGREYRW